MKLGCQFTPIFSYRYITIYICVSVYIYIYISFYIHVYHLIYIYHSIYKLLYISLCIYIYVTIYLYIYIHTHVIYICIYLSLYTHHRFKVGGRTQNVSYIFEGVFEGGLDNVSLHFEGILKTLPAKMTPGGRSATNFTHLRGESQINVSYILVWSPPEKSP